MEGLDFGAMLDDDQVMSLFGDDNESQDNSDSEEENLEENNETNNKNNNNNTADVNPEEMFEGTQESVGSGNHKDNEEDANSDEGSTSPDFFSSIANAFVEEGIFPDLDEDTIKGIKSAADFRKAIDNQIRAGLDEQQRRVAEALDNNVQPDQIRQYEGVIQYLNSIDNNTLNAEDNEGENLRKRIIFQDYINKGFSKERAEKMVNKAFENGSDIDDAKEALESTKEYYRNAYQELLDDAKAEKEQEIEEQKKKAERIRKSILEENKFFGDIEIDKSTRQVAFDAISKPIYRDSKTGQTYTAVQKLELDNSEEFLAKLGLVYALTDGFKSIDNLVKKKVKKEVKKGFLDLENKINNTTRDSKGNIRFTSGVSDENSVLGKEVRFDL